MTHGREGDGFCYEASSTGKIHKMRMQMTGTARLGHGVRYGEDISSFLALLSSHPAHREAGESIT